MTGSGRRLGAWGSGAAALVLLGLSCAGRSARDEPDGAAGASVGGAGGTAGSAAGTAGSGERPIPDTLCNAYFNPSCSEGDACTCRDDVRPACQTTMTCVGARWELVPGTCTTPAAEAPCPPSPEAARDLPCAPLDRECRYPGALSCYCEVPHDLAAYVCGGDGPRPRLWDCGGEQQGCPAGVPDVGSACAVEEQHCGDPCANAHARRCRNGLWERWTPERECV